MASQYSPDRQPGALEKTVLPESLQSVSRAGRGETAGRRLKRGYANLIETDEDYEREDGNFPDNSEITLQLFIHGYLPT